MYSFVYFRKDNFIIFCVKNVDRQGNFAKVVSWGLQLSVFMQIPNPTIIEQFEFWI